MLLLDNHIEPFCLVELLRFDTVFAEITRAPRFKLLTPIAENRCSRTCTGEARLGIKVVPIRYLCLMFQAITWS
jgi:hypothetical protein